MKEEVTNKFMEKMLAYVNKGEVFLEGQVPKYIDELLTYNMYQSLLWVFICLCILAGVCFICKKLWEEGGEAILILVLVAFFFGLTTTVAMVDNLSTAIKIKVAPRVYIIDYLRR